MRDKWLTVAAFVMGFDQISKYYMTTELTVLKQIIVFPGFDFVLRHNTGAAFSLLASAPGWQRWFFIGLGFLVSFIIYIWMGRLSAKQKLEGFALALIFGGAVGNMLDRILLGSVTDFILLYYKTWEWPAFNLADMAIFFGVVLLIPTLFKKS